MNEIIITILVIVAIVYIFKPKKEKEKDYWIEYFPVQNKFIAKTKDGYPFQCVGGYWILMDRPNDSEMCIIKEDAEERLKLYLEYKGKDVIKLEANI